MRKNKKTAGQTGELFKQTVPKMPEGYYSGDKPNPNLRAFVEQHLREKPYDPANDNYEVSGFNDTLTIENRRDPINDLHIYWSKKPYKAIGHYVRHFTASGDLILDPFSGTGSTALAALIEGRKAVAIDRSPAATFITKNYCTSVDASRLRSAFQQVHNAVEEKLNCLYETRCDRCGGKAMTSYTAYSQVFQCPKCLTKLPLFDCVEVESKTAGGKPKTANACPFCFKRGYTEIIRSQSEKFGFIPVAVSYICESGCSPKRGERTHNDPDEKKREFFRKHDVTKLEEIENQQIKCWVPRGFDMTGFSRYQRDALRLYGVREICDLFTARNLRGLATILEAIDKSSCRDALRFAFSGALFNATRMYQHREAGGGPQKGTYYLPQVFREVHVWTLFDQKVENLLRASQLANFPTAFPVCISTQSATNLKALPNDSVDYIFTDPPYAEKVQYGELNFLWEAWLGFDTHWHDEEIIVNEVRGKTEDDWEAMMQQAMAECFRVLKPGRWLSLCYHDTSEGTWSLVQNIMTSVCFVADATDSALFIDTGQKSYNQLVADKVTKRDLVINFRKPKPGEKRSVVHFTGAEDQQTFREKAQTVIREFLQASPGSTKDRIYDAVVSRLVRQGQMEAHSFDELLREVAEESKEPVKKNLFENEEPDLLGSHQVGRWHLKESEAGGEEAERATADSAGTCIHDFLAKTTVAKLKESECRVCKLQADIAQLRARLQAVDHGKSDESRGKLVREIRELTEKLDRLTAQRAEWERQALDYSQIFEFYIAAVNPKPKATLEEILEDYCYQTDEGSWRPPRTEPEKKEKGSERQRAVRRKIQRFCNILDAGYSIPEGQRPDAPTLAEWIRHCRRTGLHAQGKLLYERGGDLSALNEQAQVDVEEDYQVCVKHLERGSK